MNTAMAYADAWAYLDGLQFFKIKLGLHSMERFLARVGNPHREMRFIHIAGTNGKGSVAANLITLLSAAGHKTGLFTSPHLSSVRERFRIGDRYMPEDDFAAIAGRIREVLGDEQITYFEFTTAMALLWFARERVDPAIMEVGMGGRLDATNVVTPLVSVITSISMDHEAYLGTTIEAVAGEKAGIVKPGVPVVCAAKDEALEVVASRCAELGSPLYRIGRDFSLGEDGVYRGLAGGRTLARLVPGLRGGHQYENTALALACLELLAGQGIAVDDTTIRETLPRVRWPGRLEEIQVEDCRFPGAGIAGDPRRTFLLDGAHNPGGVAALTETLQREYAGRRLIFIWGAMADKDLALTLPVIAPVADHVVLTSVGGERAASADGLARLLAAPISRTVSRDVPEALARAVAVSRPEDLIVVAGSLYLVGSVRKLLVGELAR
ncbi:MAG: folylpolyglutamate synthase/dihydrofolate synthase family protein [Thermodesulfobacteriota bacterium]